MLVVTLDGASIAEDQAPDLTLPLREHAVDEREAAVRNDDLVPHRHVAHAAETGRSEHERVKGLCLAGTHLALQQPVHRMLGRQVVEDLLGDLLLTFGEGEGEAVVECRQEAVGLGFAGDRRELGVGVAAPGEGHLEDEGLVPLEAGAGVLDVGLCVRAVDLEEGLGEGTRPRPSRSVGGRGSTASCALGRTVWRALPIFQDSSLAVAG